MAVHHFYVDIAKEIELIDIRIHDLEREKKHYLRMMHANAPAGLSSIDYSEERVMSSFEPLPLDQVVSRINMIDKMLLSLYNLQELKQKSLERIDKGLSELTTLEHRVAYRTLKGQSLIEIAEELDYSYDWIKKISSKANKALSRHSDIENL